MATVTDARIRGHAVDALFGGRASILFDTTGWPATKAAPLVGRRLAGRPRSFSDPASWPATEAAPLLRYHGAPTVFAMADVSEKTPWPNHCSVVFADGHTASNAPDLFRPPKLSGAGPGEYWGG